MYVAQRAYEPYVGDSTMKSRWREYKLQAVCLYLMLNQKFNMKPPQVCSKKFVNRLLQKAENVSELRRYFSAYQTVRTALLSQKYGQFPALDLDLGRSPPRLDAAVFSPGIAEAFDRWLQH